MDDAGRVRIYKTHHTSGRLKLHYVSSNDENHDLTAVACLFWLSVEPHVRMVSDQDPVWLNHLIVLDRNVLVCKSCRIQVDLRDEESLDSIRHL